MPAELITTEHFNFGGISKDLRIFKTQKGPMVPLVDIASSLDYDRSGLNHLINGQEEIFSDMKGVVQTTTPGGFQELVCLNRDGLLALLVKINYKKIKNAKKSEKVKDFQIYALKKLSKVLSGEQDSPIMESTDPVLESLNRNADRMEALIKRYDFDPLVARKLAMEMVVAEHPEAIIFRGPTLLPAGSESEPAPALLPAAPSIDIAPDPDFDAMYPLSKLAEFCKISENQARNILEDAKVIYHSPAGIWVVQDAKYGKMFDMAVCLPGNTKRKQFARYTPAARDLVLDKLKGEQATLGEGKA